MIWIVGYVLVGFLSAVVWARYDEVMGDDVLWLGFVWLLWPGFVAIGGVMRGFGLLVRTVAEHKSTDMEAR